MTNHYGQVTDAPVGLPSEPDVLPASYFQPGDVITCTVTPNDGVEDGVPSTSPSITSANTPPSVSQVLINPNPASASDGLVCDYLYTDLDATDDQSTVSWAINGVASGTGDILLSGFDSGDSVTCTVTAYDGTDFGNTLSSPSIIINTPPVVSDVEVIFGSLGAPICDYTFADIDGDTDQSTPSFTLNGTSLATEDFGTTDLSLSSSSGCASDPTTTQCWGNSSVNYELPDELSNLGVATIEPGYDFACALDLDGGVHCWGQDASNQVSDAPTNTGYTSLSADTRSACATRSTGALECWGLAQAAAHQ